MMFKLPCIVTFNVINNLLRNLPYKLLKGVYVISIREPVIHINDFNQPKILEGVEAYYTLIVRLILLNPGVIKSHPEMGVGLVNKWRFCDVKELSNLEKSIYDQMSTYLPILLVSDVNARYDDQVLILEIILDQETIVLETSDFKTLKLKDIFK